MLNIKTPFQSIPKNWLFFIGLWILLSVIAISFTLLGIFNLPTLLFGSSLAIGFQILTDIGLASLFVLFTAGIFAFVKKLSSENTLPEENIIQPSLNINTVRKDELERNKLAPNAVKVLFNFLQSDNLLKKLTLFFTPIEHENAMILNEMLKKNTTLETLHLYSDKIDDTSLEAFSGALTQNTTLTKLNLRNNAFRDTGVLALSKALKKNTSLTKLNLAGNIFRDAGVKALSDILKQSTALKSLHLPLTDNARQQPKV